MPYTKINALLPGLGLDVSQPAEYLQTTASPNHSNISIDRKVVRKRTGTIAVGTTMSEEIMAIHELILDDERIVVRIGLTKVNQLNESTSAWSDITGSDLTGTSADTFSVATPMLSGKRVLVFTNLVDNIRKFIGTGNTADLGGTPPKAKFAKEYGSYLLISYIEDGGNKYRMRVQWCDAGDIETWSGGNAGYVDLVEDGNDITGMSLFGNYVCIHKETAIYLGYLVSSADVFNFERKNTGVGTVCNNTIQNIGENAQVFLARDGIRVFNGISAPRIESPVNDELKESMNPEYIHKCWSVVIPELNEYWVGVPIGSQTAPDTVYKYNYETGLCYKDTRPGVTAVGKYQRTSALTWQDDSGTWDEATDRWDDVTLLSLHPTVMFGTSTGLTTRRDSAYNSDNGTAVTASAETKDYTCLDLGVTEPGRYVRWTELQVIAKGSGTLNVEYSTDSGGTWSSLTDITLTSDYPTDSSPIYGYFDVVSSKLRLRFKNSGTLETFYLRDYILRGKVREMRK